MNSLQLNPYRNEGWQTDIYPMPAFPVLMVADLQALTKWYEAIGFADVFTMRGADGRPFLVHLRWARYADLLLKPAPAGWEEPRGSAITLTFLADDVDAVAQRAAENGATILDGPIDRPWNAREVLLADPEGYRLTFTAPTAAALEKRESMEDLTARLKRGQ
jgi:uncharacterized glyoxalase superfamily protein PhnB